MPIVVDENKAVEEDKLMQFYNKHANAKVTKKKEEIGVVPE